MVWATVSFGMPTAIPASMSDAPAPSLRPSNPTRAVFHVSCGLVALVLIHFLPTKSWLIGVAVACAVAGWSMEVARRLSPRANAVIMRVFRAVAHPHERTQVNSSTWYVTALVLLAVFFPRVPSAVGVVVLAVA